MLQNGQTEFQIRNVKFEVRNECGFSLWRKSQRVDKPIDTLADEEKGRKICSKQARRRTRVR